MKISAFITLLVSLTTVSWSLAQEPTNTDTEAEITLETVIPETEDRDISAPKIDTKRAPFEPQVRYI